VAAATESPADVDAARRIDALANRLFLDPILVGAYPADLVEDLASLMSFDHVQDGYLELISQPIEALGVNYYMKLVVRAGKNHRFLGTPYVGSGDVDFVGAGLPQSARGWEINPDGLYELLTHLTRTYPGAPALGSPRTG
jgi:beta-glucosidase